MSDLDVIERPLKVEGAVKTEKPPMFRVVIVEDQSQPLLCCRVRGILQGLFNLSSQRINAIYADLEREDSATVMVYPTEDVAETLTLKANASYASSCCGNKTEAHPFTYEAI